VELRFGSKFLAPLRLCVKTTLTTIPLKQTLIPATDDPTYVPSATLYASTNSAGQVQASVAVTGGTPPYTYLWGGTAPSLSTKGQ